ncbi:MAG: DUF6602 domain-containing protein [Nitrospiria bacterium]
MTRFEKIWARAFATRFWETACFRDFSKNPAVIGAYTEELVRQEIRRAVAPLRTSTGSIIHEADLDATPSEKQKIPQIDVIIWSGHGLPPLFQQGNFALIPKSAARGIVEIKKSLKGSIDEFREQLRARQSRLDLHLCQAFTLGVVLQHTGPIDDCYPDKDWPVKRWNRGEREPLITSILIEGENGDYQPNVQGILLFLYFLSHIHIRAIAGVNIAD